ncbi:hypothetical protein Ciccas_011097 [Cichlidogyrus casuarinus]|uniref:Uncharacterized protein n=1 Tax=Cichlidogyrus casuarinus TaxID=1844966 RepID=A0ABD2PWY0_9PLAT
MDSDAAITHFSFPDEPPNFTPKPPPTTNSGRTRSTSHHLQRNPPSNLSSPSTGSTPTSSRVDLAAKIPASFEIVKEKAPVNKLMGNISLVSREEFAQKKKPPSSGSVKAVRKSIFSRFINK